MEAEPSRQMAMVRKVLVVLHVHTAVEKEAMSDAEKIAYYRERLDAIHCIVQENAEAIENPFGGILGYKLSLGPEATRELWNLSKYWDVQPKKP